MEELKRISASEVRLHTSKNDCWLVIHGKVYDVTKFLDSHPGGHEVLVHASGTGDATESFEDVGHSSAARRRMTNYLIGVLEGYDPSKSPQPEKITITRDEALAKVREAQQKSSFAISDFLLPLFLLAVAIGAWLLLNENNTA